MKDFLKFYSEDYDEDTRLLRHGTEFVSTTYILDKLIDKGSRILDVGAGTGAYSVFYARKGCSVVAIDAVPKNIDKLRGKIRIQPDLDIKAYVSDIRSPSISLGIDYDIMLFMGPIYHLPLPEAESCLDYCLGLLKKDGILAVSYVNRHEGHQGSKYQDVFITYKPIEIERLLNSRITPIFHGPTDGEVFGELNYFTEGLHEEMSKLHDWLDHNLSVFQDPGWLKTSIHGLYIGRKRAVSKPISQR
jgi:SAM-dependent methyltransferase